MPFIQHDGRIVLFVHIPKTGGSSVEAWLGAHAHLHFHTAGLTPPALRCTPQHLRFWDLAQIFQPTFFDYSFAIVRNPFRRLESEYRMRAIVAKEQLLPQMPTFPLWLAHNLEMHKQNAFHLDNHMRPQWHFPGRRTEVFKIEDGLDKIIGKVSEKIGLPKPDILPHEMSSTAFEGQIEWDMSDVISVQEAYRQDFEEFGYSLDP